MAIKFKEIRRFLARNTRLSICFEDGDYHNYLLISDIPSLEYDELYVYGVGMIVVEFSKDIYSEPEEPNGEVSISMSNLTIQPALEIVLSDKPRDIERNICDNLTFKDLKPYLQVLMSSILLISWTGQMNHISAEKTFQKNMTTCMCMALEWRESLTIRKE